MTPEAPGRNRKPDLADLNLTFKKGSKGFDLKLNAPCEVVDINLETNSVHLRYEVGEVSKTIEYVLNNIGFGLTRDELTEARKSRKPNNDIIFSSGMTVIGPNHKRYLIYELTKKNGVLLLDIDTNTILPRITSEDFLKHFQLEPSPAERTLVQTPVARRNTDAGTPKITQWVQGRTEALLN